jgi:hypothetical protein
LKRCKRLTLCFPNLQFVVDGNWTHDHTRPIETEDDNKNNVLQPSDLTLPTMSSVAPGSTTAALAGQVPKEGEDKSAIPGAFIETPAANDDQSFSVKPIPATPGMGNPIQLKPGEKVPDPSTLTGNTVESTVTTDKASYENGGAVAIPSAPKDDANNTLPPIQKGMIPESSLPMGANATDGTSAFISSVGPTSTTAALAGKVPLEPNAEEKVPEVVTESQEKAHVDPEASANPTAVEEKHEVEDELKSKVPEAPATSESPLTAGNVAASVGGAAAAAGAAIVGTAAAAKKNAVDTATSASSAAQGMVSGAEEKALPPASDTAAGVPEIVTESIKESHQGAEAAANPEAVAEKKAVEDELESKVARAEQSGEPAPTETAAKSEVAPGGAAAAASKDKSEPAPAAAATTETPAAVKDTTDGPSEGPSTPQKKNGTSADTPEGSASAKKSKRKSFLLHLKKIFK